MSRPEREARSAGCVNTCAARARVVGEVPPDCAPKRCGAACVWQLWLSGVSLKPMLQLKAF